ncbi:hypothetical protein [Nitrosospira sp. NpAV]|uniref:hypothetical protein n=1 Tax=Nitrosospira sp. NpAV TaxID=58133 RepID=UPI0005A160E8|nr:hypothetical protein [Nitrosospira sp. NpAV]KIO49581.1 hypothetical protein SQ11_05470 [Nitrosospira sp. NpAV]
MSNEEEKGVQEAKFFSKFVAISGLPYNLSTIEKRPPHLSPTFSVFTDPMVWMLKRAAVMSAIG